MSSKEDYTIEELLGLLEREPEKAPDLLPEESSKISQFIREYRIYKGVDRIPTHIIFYTYKVKFGGEMSKIEFFRNFKKEFTQRRTGTQRVYLLTADSFDLSREGRIEASFHNEKSKK